MAFGKYPYSVLKPRDYFYISNETRSVKVSILFIGWKYRSNDIRPLRLNFIEKFSPMRFTLETN